MRILLIEDDANLCHLTAFQLKKEGFTVDTCLTGEDAFYYIDTRIHDLVLLDIMLPGMDGIAILKKLREGGNMVPVILLTALGELDDKIKGLNAGADDYLVKPFAFEELLARIHCIQRRPRKLTTSTLLTFGDLTYNTANNMLTGQKLSVTLSKREGDLFEFFLHNSAQTLSRGALLAKVWGADDFVEDGNLDNYIHFLRRRLKSIGSCVSIKTIRGIGYQILEETHV